MSCRNYQNVSAPSSRIAAFAVMTAPTLHQCRNIDAWIGNQLSCGIGEARVIAARNDHVLSPLGLFGELRQLGLGLMYGVNGHERLTN